MSDGRIPYDAAHPKARREKLLAQTSYLKTLWDLSVRLRARRLVEIYQQAKPSSPTDGAGETGSGAAGLS